MNWSKLTVPADHRGTVPVSFIEVEDKPGLKLLIKYNSKIVLLLVYDLSYNV